MSLRLSALAAALLLPGMAGAADYAQVHAILERSCVGCHGPHQSKSALRLDTIDGIRKGGEHGPAVIPGFPADSALYARCCLPSDDSDAMPARGARLSAADLEVLSGWILAGANAPADAAGADHADAAPAGAAASGANPPAPAGGDTMAAGGETMAGAGSERPAAVPATRPAAPAHDPASAPASASAPPASGVAAADSPSAATDFAPVAKIFASACVQCHGPDKSKGKLRLDTLAGVRAGGKSGPAVVPGAPERSLLVTRVSLGADDPDIMPADGPHLNTGQIATITDWIKKGAWTAVPAAGTAFVPPASAPGDAPTLAKAFNPKDAPDTELDTLSAGMAPPDAKRLDELTAQGMWWRPVCKNGALIELDCRQVPAKDVGGALGGLGSVADHVAWLNLAGTGVEDSDLGALKGIKHLQRLHLERTTIDDLGLAKVAACPGLVYLNLYGTPVTDSGLLKLAPLKHLAQIFLRDSKATPEGASALQALIPGLVAVFDEALPTGPLPEKKKGKKQN
jgi:hypothetical protein